MRTICVMAELAHDDPVSRLVRSEMILESLEEFAPGVEIVEPGTYLVPALGPARYHGGEESLANQMRRSVVDVLAGPKGVHPPVVVIVAGGPVISTLVARAVMGSGGGENRKGAGGHGGRSGGGGACSRGGSRGTEGTLVLADGADVAHLAELSIHHVAHLLDPGVVDLFVRLGLGTVGAFTALPVTDVGARFGPVVARIHRILKGAEDEPSRPEIPTEDMGSTELLEPPLETVDQIAFVARTMAHEVMERLSSRHVSADTVLISIGTDTGERVERTWRVDRGLSVPVMTQRVRWQMEGWLRSRQHEQRSGHGPVCGTDGSSDSGEVIDVGAASSIRIEPGDIRPYRGVQMGFWGETDDHDRLVLGGLDRIRGLFGADAVTVPRPHGGRSPHQSHHMVDPDRNRLDDRPITPGRRSARSTGGVVEPWPGSIPEPFPTRVWADPLPAEVVDGDGEPVGVSGRGVISSTPERLSVDGGPWWRIAEWAGPWCVDERWWDPVGHRRKARIQVLVEPLAPVAVPADHVVVPIGSGRSRRPAVESGPGEGSGSVASRTVTQAHLLTLEVGRWWVEATYD